jgi:hypothetical protein
MRRRVASESDGTVGGRRACVRVGSFLACATAAGDQQDNEKHSIDAQHESPLGLEQTANNLPYHEAFPILIGTGSKRSTGTVGSFRARISFNSSAENDNGPVARPVAFTSGLDQSS